MMNRKRIWIIAILVCLIGSVGYSVYYKYIRNNPLVNLVRIGTKMQSNGMLTACTNPFSDAYDTEVTNALLISQRNPDSALPVFLRKIHEGSADAGIYFMAGELMLLASDNYGDSEERETKSRALFTEGANKYPTAVALVMIAGTNDETGIARFERLRSVPGIEPTTLKLIENSINNAKQLLARKVVFQERKKRIDEVMAEWHYLMDKEKILGQEAKSIRAEMNRYPRGDERRKRLEERSKQLSIERAELFTQMRELSEVVQSIHHEGDTEMAALKQRLKAMNEASMN